MVQVTSADLTEDQMTGQWHRHVGTFLTPDSLPAAKAALSSRCSEERAAKLFAAMTVMLRSSNDDNAKADVRLRAFASRLSQYPEVVVASVLAEWSETQSWQPAWADLKQPADRAVKALTAVITATERRHEQERQGTTEATAARGSAAGEERTDQARAPDRSRHA